MAVNIAEIYSPDPFASGGTADSYKRRLLAAQLLQKKASEDDKVYSNSHGGMKLATALLGGMMEGWEERKAKQGQAAVGRDLASALAAGVGGMGGVSAPSSPSSGSPAGAPSLAGGGASRAMAMPSDATEMAAAIEKSAKNLGISPIDLATVISYETGGKMSPSVWGGAGGRHMGLIQFGPTERQMYGANPNQSFSEQMGAVERYLSDRGLKPGMGLMDLYSTINAGRPGRFGASDANNGGAPGTVADKVNNQMAGHRARAEALFGTLSDAPQADASEAAVLGGAEGFAVPNPGQDPTVMPVADAPSAAALADGLMAFNSDQPIQFAQNENRNQLQPLKPSKNTMSEDDKWWQDYMDGASRQWNRPGDGGRNMDFMPAPANDAALQGRVQVASSDPSFVPQPASDPRGILEKHDREIAGALASGNMAKAAQLSAMRPALAKAQQPDAAPQPARLPDPNARRDLQPAIDEAIATGDYEKLERLAKERDRARGQPELPTDPETGLPIDPRTSIASPTVSSEARPQPVTIAESPEAVHRAERAMNPEAFAPVAPPPPPLPPERPPETYTPRAPRVPPQAMAQALMAGGAPQIDPNSNNAGAMQFAAAGMGRGGQGMPQAPQQPPPQMAAQRAPSAPSGMYGGGVQPNAQYAQAGPASAPVPARTAAPAQPAMDPRAAAALRVINSPWATAGQISAAQNIIKQLQPDIQLIPTADGHIIAVDKHNPGKGATSVYKAPEKGVVVEGEIRSSTTGQPIGPRREYKPLVTQEDRAKYGIQPDDKRPYVVGPDNRPIVTPGDPSTNVTVGTGETEEQKERGKGLAKRINTIADDGDEAAKDLAVAQRLHQLGTNVNPGTKTALLDEIRARTGIALDPNADNVQAYKAMIAYMKPRMRVAGSGVSSDKDMAAFEQSLPSLLGTPGGNELATQTIGSMAQLRLERGLLAQRWQLGEIDAKTFNAELAKLPDPFATFKEWQKANGGAASQGGTPASPSGGGVIRYDSQGRRIQ
jgi:hypothetical protein